MNNKENVPKEHQLICNTCGKILDMRDLGKILSHGIGRGDGTYYCLSKDEEIDIEYDGSGRIGSSLYYPKRENKPLNLN